MDKPIPSDQKEGATLDLITYQDFEELLHGPRGHYYTGSWEYFEEVLQIIQKERVATALELGPGFLPIVKNSDIMLNPEQDHFGVPINTSHKVIIHDATIKPWPIKDKEYDLFIALQVWEHLDNKQSRAFREVMRISRMAIFKFSLFMGRRRRESHAPRPSRD